MNRSLANKTRVVSKAAAGNRSQASSQDKAVSRVDNRSPGKAASKVSAKISPTDFPRPCRGFFSPKQSSLWAAEKSWRRLNGHNQLPKILG
jgi:hypothetical protein